MPKKELLNKVVALWEKNPEQSLCQLIRGVTGGSNCVSDEELSDSIDRRNKRIKQGERNVR